MRIPNYWRDGNRFIAQLENPIQVVRENYTFIIEPCRPDCYHAVTVEDMVKVLDLLPKKYVEGIAAFVLRQPTKKQESLYSVWGRLAYFAEIDGCKGAIVFLESRKKEDVVNWTKSLDPDGQAELDRIREDGHKVIETRRSWQVHSDFNANRATQLFRTLPHEVGHFVQFCDMVEFPGEIDFDLWDQLNKKHNQLTTKEKEHYAHRFADEFAAAHEAEGVFPFDPIHDVEQMKKDGLDPAWFNPDL